VHTVDQIFYVAHTVDVDILDPQISGMIVAGDVILTMFDTLLVRDMDGAIQHNMVSRPTSFQTMDICLL